MPAVACVPPRFRLEVGSGICAEFALTRLFGAKTAQILLNVLFGAVVALLLGGGLLCLRGGDGPALFLAGVWLFALRKGGGL